MPSLPVYSNGQNELKYSLSATKEGVPRIMGIVNVTPDSFHSASRKITVKSALETAKIMLENGATWIDIGGESTRPGADEVSIEEELNRVIPVISALKKEFPEVLISIDTRKAKVAQNAIMAGASMINDVSGFRNQDMKVVAVESGVAVCIMHMLGEPKTMQTEPSYVDCREEIYTELKNTASSLVEMGLPKELIVLDPGIGFGKYQKHNLELLSDISNLKALDDNNSPERGWNVMWGTSRKSVIGKITGKESPDERLAGTLATAAQAQLIGVDILRVHDVEEHIDFLNVFSKIR